METPNIVVDNKSIALDFSNAVSGKVPQSKIDQTIAMLSDDLTAYYADCLIDSYLFYASLKVTVSGGKILDGDAGGIFTPGVSRAYGTIYTSDIDALYANTTNFYVASAAAYFTLVFFDSDHNSLGSFQAGSIGSVFGTGGGTGTWS
jgi:hypothetical protein